MPATPAVSIIMGSDSDLEIMNEAAKALDLFEVPYEIDICSAHRSPAAVPIAATTLGGLDALLAMVQMPAGIPVATVAIGQAGATNAGILAVQILATADPALTSKLAAYKQQLAQGVAEKSRKLQGERSR